MHRTPWKFFSLPVFFILVGCGPQPKPPSSPAQPPPSEDGTKIPLPGSEDPAAEAPDSRQPTPPGSPASSGSAAESLLGSGSSDWFAELGIPARTLQGSPKRR